MKKVVAISLGLLMVLAIVACNGGGTPAPAAPADGPRQASDLRIGVLVFQEDMFMQLYTMGAQSAAAQWGVSINAQNSMNDASREAEIINTWVEQGFDGFVFMTPDNAIIVHSLRRAHEAGMEIVAGSTLTDEGYQYVRGTIATSQESLGVAAGRAAVQYIQENNIYPVNIGIVQFAAQVAWSSAARVDNFLLQLEEAGIEYNVLSDQDGHMADIAIAVATDMLTAAPDINIMFAANSGGTIGTTMAVRNLGLTDQITVFGVDADEQICGFILSDDYPLVGVAAQDPFGNAFTATDILIRGLLGYEITEFNETYIVRRDGVGLSIFDRAEVEDFLEMLRGLN